jgi:protease IV
MTQPNVAARWGARVKTYLAGVGALAVVSVVGAAATRANARSRRKVVPAGAVLHLDMSMPIVEATPNPTALSALLSPRPPLSLRSIVTALEAAAKDSRVKGVICTFGTDTAPPLAVVQELGNAILAFREAQNDEPEAKRRFAWVTTDTFGEAGGGVGMQQYLLAAHFDKVFMQPSGLLGLLGVHQPVFFIKKLLAKLGVQPQFFQFFEYKNAPNSLTQEGFTEAHRHQSQLLADSIFDQLTASIARLRGRSVPQIRESIDAAPLNAQQALEQGLIDAVLYPDQVMSMVSGKEGDHSMAVAAKEGNARPREAKPKMVSMRSYIQATQGGKQDSMLGGFGSSKDKKPRIALIHACGNIIRGRGDSNSSEPEATSAKVGAAIRSAYLDKSVKAIVVRVDSRGGSAVASDSIRRELEKARTFGLPVVVSMGAYAASGGYFIATGADRIVAQPGTITGSIGAFLGIFNMQKLFSDLGIDVDEISIGKDANFARNPARPLSESQTRKAEAIGRQVSGQPGKTTLCFAYTSLARVAV